MDSFVASTDSWQISAAVACKGMEVLPRIHGPAPIAAHNEETLAFALQDIDQLESDATILEGLIAGTTDATPEQMEELSRFLLITRSVLALRRTLKAVMQAEAAQDGFVFQKAMKAWTILQEAGYGGRREQKWLADKGCDFPVIQEKARQEYEQDAHERFTPGDRFEAYAWSTAERSINDALRQDGLLPPLPPVRPTLFQHLLRLREQGVI